MFRNEIDAYALLSGSTMCPRFFGGYRGIGFTGQDTGIILLEKLPTVFHEISDMTLGERNAAYNHVLKLHDLGLHHGDVEAGNFARRKEQGESNKLDADHGIVVCDFSHSDFFEGECDTEQCWELYFAKRKLLGEQEDSQ